MPIGISQSGCKVRPRSGTGGIPGTRWSEAGLMAQWHCRLVSASPGVEVLLNNSEWADNRFDSTVCNSVLLKSQTW